jgi:hypothetical protein
MEFRNDVLLQLVECIESTQNEVKRKMVEEKAYNDAPKSPAALTREEKIIEMKKLSRPVRPVEFAAIDFTRTVLEDGRSGCAGREPRRHSPPSIMKDDFQAKHL